MKATAISWYNPPLSEKENIVERNSKVLLEHFTEEDKHAFIEKYHEAWALLDSGLPIYD